MNRIEQRCLDKGLRMTDQRRVIAQVMADAEDHPDVEEIHNRAHKIDNRISIATAYRTMRLFEEYDIVERHDFNDGRARYEEATDEHHDHLINIRTGDVIEFVNDEIEQLQKDIAAKYGFKLIDHRLELYGVPIKDEEE
ncbi:MAG: Fur family transcriptional regulator [bacterium]